MKIREARPEDVDALYLLEVRAHQAPWPRDAFEDEFLAPQSKIWVIDGDDRLAAMVVFWRVLREVEILDVAVDPLYQGRGLAKHLLGTLIGVCATTSVERILLEVRVSNQPAIGLYENLGFVRVGRRPEYYEDNGEDAFVMALVLAEDN